MGFSVGSQLRFGVGSLLGFGVGSQLGLGVGSNSGFGVQYGCHYYIRTRTHKIKICKIACIMSSVYSFVFTSQGSARALALGISLRKSKTYNLGVESPIFYQTLLQYHYV